MYLVADVEADGFDPTVIHVISVKEYPSGDMMSFTNMDFFREWVRYLNSKKKIKKWFFHNGLGYDVDVINKLVEPGLIKHRDVVDTMVVSRLVNYSKFRTHSLKELGEFLGTHKGDYTGGFDHYSEEMREYCEQDVEVLCSVVKFYWDQIMDPAWAAAMKTEHEMAKICKDMQVNGFEFDKDLAESLLSDVTKDKTELEDSFKVAFGSKLVEVKNLKLRKKADGTLFKNIQEAVDKYPKVVIDEEKEVVLVYDYKDFNPGSPRERIDVLWDAGWEPYEKTKGHIKAMRTARKGW